MKRAVEQLSPAADFLLVEEQFPVPLGIMIVDIALLERIDVEPDQPDLALSEDGVAVLKICISLPERLDLGPLENDSRLIVSRTK